MDETERHKMLRNIKRAALMKEVHDAIEDPETERVILVLRPTPTLDVGIDRALPLADLTDGEAMALNLRCRMNPDMRAVMIGAPRGPVSRVDDVVAWFEGLTIAHRQEIYNTKGRTLG